MTTFLTLRAAVPTDAPAIAALHRAAFAGEAEAAIVARAVPTLSLVALHEGAVAGHLLLTAATAAGPPRTTGAALGPMAVLPALQRRGIGSALVRAALRHADARGMPFLVLVGEPGFYERFGFTSADAQGLGCEWSGVPSSVWLARVADGAAPRGVVRYDAAFGAA